MSIYKKGNIWHVYYIDCNGKRVRQSTGTTDQQKAQELHDKLKSEQWATKKLGDKPKYTWQEAVVRYLQEQSEKKSLVTDKFHLRWIDAFLGDKKLYEITRSTLDYVKSEKLKTGVSNATVNRMLSTIKKILNTAHKDWGWLEGTPSVKMLIEPKERVRFLTKEQAENLILELPKHLSAMVRFSLATGLRESNVTGLQWSEIDIPRKTAWINARNAKSGKSIAVPLNDDAMQVLQNQLGNHRTNVFTYKDNPVLKAGSTAWDNALKRAGIEDFRWHDLRHTWASWHIQSGTPINALKELGGWSDLDMVLRYAHLSSEHLAQYANASKIETSTFTPPLLKLLSSK